MTASIVKCGRVGCDRKPGGPFKIGMGPSARTAWLCAECAAQLSPMFAEHERKLRVAQATHTLDVARAGGGWANPATWADVKKNALESLAALFAVEDELTAAAIAWLAIPEGTADEQRAARAARLTDIALELSAYDPIELTDTMPGDIGHTLRIVASVSGQTKTYTERAETLRRAYDQQRKSLDELFDGKDTATEGG